MLQHLRRRSRWGAVPLLLVLLAGALPAGAEPERGGKTDKPAEAPPKGLRVFTCGHSFHAFVPRS
jgi:hypothetical protein